MNELEIKTLLKDLKLKETDVDFMWKFCKTFNHSLTLNFSDWRQINIKCAIKLPKTYKRLSKRMIYGNSNN